MLYEHIYTNCFADEIGPTGLERDSYVAVLSETRDLLDGLKAARDDASLSMLLLPPKIDDLAPLQAVADRFRAKFNDVVKWNFG